MIATRSLSVAIVQAAPVPLAITAGLGALLDHARPLADAGVALAVFGESFVGGYPLWFDHAPGAGLWQQSGTKALHAILLREAIVADDPRLAPIQELADASGMLVSFGAHERVRNSLFNSQILIRPNAPPLVHRKLVPTHGERLIWARGDGATLEVHTAPWGRIGSLICWEHWMPLARATMHHAGETVHVAAWPTLGDMHLVASRHYAFEGRCFVLAAATVQTTADLLAGLALAGGDSAAQALLETMPRQQLQHGGSAIIAPDGRILSQAGAEPGVIRAQLDLSEIDRELTTLDTDGHYARPDIFGLTVNRDATPGVRDETL